MQDYIIQLDNDNYGWSFLWNNTIHELKSLSLNLEILSVNMQLLLVRTDSAGYQLMQKIEGIKNIEKDEVGYLI